MATLYVSWLGGAQYGVAKEPIGSTTVTTSGTSAKTAASSGAGIAVVVSDAAHYVNVGPVTDLVASAANGMYVPANAERHIALNPGDAVAAITV